MDFMITFLNSTIDRYNIFVKWFLTYKVDINLFVDF